MVPPRMINTPTLKGRAEAGSKVIIYDNGNKIGVVETDGVGELEFRAGRAYGYWFTHTYRNGQPILQVTSLRYRYPWSINIVLGRLMHLLSTRSTTIMAISCIVSHQVM
ncbi:Uncharacterised protein [Serratia fonticola]|uniref:Uncharacterized protein n=1 Tax=Serratia fonticola TaxID=47917 RepID=A0A4V6KP07_SERFO|nr:Uncharacterised protein [Serratia fonticola]